MFTEKEISGLSTDSDGRTQDNGKITFGVLRTKRMKALIYWVKYFYHISGDPTIIGFDKVMFIQLLYTALYRSEIRDKIIYQSYTKANESPLGPLES